MPISSRATDYSMMALSVLCGVGSIALFVVWPFELAPLSLGNPGTLLWDGLLSAAFFVQHSVMVRRSFKERLVRVAPERYVGAVYTIGREFGQRWIARLTGADHDAAAVVRDCEAVEVASRKGDGRRILVRADALRALEGPRHDDDRAPVDGREVDVEGQRFECREGMRERPGG